MDKNKIQVRIDPFLKEYKVMKKLIKKLLDKNPKLKEPFSQAGLNLEIFQKNEEHLQRFQ